MDLTSYECQESIMDSMFQEMFSFFRLLLIPVCWPFAWHDCHRSVQGQRRIRPPPPQILGQMPPPEFHLEGEKKKGGKMYDESIK